ncbi:MAG: HDOD domain-containing protein [Limnobacter sp.]|nr:HDOD domain-containing protein [Limnobacter sp.]
MSISSRRVDIPALLPTSTELLNRFQDDDSSLGELAELIQLDPSLTSKLLRMANSAFFGMGGRVSSIEEAMTVVGLANTRGFVLADVLMGQFKKDPWSQMNLKEFWTTSLCMGCTCSVLALRAALPPDPVLMVIPANPANSLVGEVLPPAADAPPRPAVSPNVAFSVGLLHRIGVLVLSASLGEKYRDLLKERLPNDELVQRERSMFDTDHAKVGSELLRYWNLPAAIVDSVGMQYQAKDELAPNMLVEILRCGHDLSEGVRKERALEFDALQGLHTGLFTINHDNFDKTVRMIKSKYKDLFHMVQGEAT